jgi:hypothetical protein
MGKVKLFSVCPNSTCHFKENITDSGKAHCAFCPKCGKPMVTACTACERPIWYKGDYCSGCGKSFKTQSDA